MRYLLTTITLALLFSSYSAQNCSLLADSIPDQNICVGDSVQLNALSGGGIGTTVCNNNTLQIPDGSGVNYTDTLSVSGFSGQFIGWTGNEVSLCLDLEHSYLGDLEVQITCPSGATATIFDAYTGGGGLINGGFSGAGGTFLGQPDDASIGSPGICWEYCFYNSATDPSWSTNLPTTPVTTPSTGNSVTSGHYQPEQNFSSLSGCPLDGDWVITLRDNLGVDDGYLCSWCLGLEGTSNIDVNWSPGAGLSDSTFGSPWASPDTTTTYTVTAWDPVNFCGDTLEVTVLVGSGTVPNLTITGPVTSTPWQTVSYSVPYDPSLTYVWSIDNGTIFNGQGTNSIDAQVYNDSTAEISVIAYNGCDSATNAMTLYIGTTGVLENEISYAISPNPAKENLTINFSDGIDQILLSDLSGRNILKENCGGKNRIQLNRNGLPNGVYLVHFLREGVQLGTTKIVFE